MLKRQLIALGVAAVWPMIGAATVVGVAAVAGMANSVAYRRHVTR